MSDETPDLATLSFEAAMQELESVVTQLESGDVALEQSIALYQRGAALRAHCAAKLREAVVGFAFTGTAHEAGYAANGADGLVATSYKDDFALIRRIDDAVGYDHQRVLEGANDEAEEADDNAD